jgi:hypothetical protein
MTLSPMEPNVITNYYNGDVSLQFQALGVKCKEMGFKNPSNALYLKDVAMSTKHNTQNIVSSLKIKQAGKDYFQWRGSIHGAYRWSVGNCDQ